MEFQMQFTGEIAELEQGIELLADSLGVIVGGENVKPGKSLVECQLYESIAIPASSGVV